MANKPLLLELWDYLKVRKRYWLLPIIIFLILVGIIIVISQSSAVSVYIYSMI